MGYALGFVFIALLVLSVPVGIAIALSSIVGIQFFSSIPMEIVAQRLVSGISSYSLLAIPLYVFAGSLMNAGGITQRLVGFAKAIVGPVRGGLAQTTIITTAVFGGISGSQVADTTSVGRLMIPQMVQAGYDRRYSASLMATAGGIFLTIPPSINLIVYGVLAQVSISDLFFYGLIIGLATVLLLMVGAYFFAIVEKHPKGERQSVKQIWTSFRRAFFSLMLPVVIIGGIRIGVFTPTEGGAVAVLFAVLIGLVVHREMNVRKFLSAALDSAVLVGVIMLIIAAAQIYSYALVTGGIPQAITALLLGITENPLVILLLINVILLLVGAVMEGNAAMIVFVPIILPVALAVGIDPLHLGLVIVLNLGIGLITPPVGLCLMVATTIARTTVQRVLPAIVPWFIICLVLLAAVTYLPPLFGWFY
ncbi:TRAP transporter large permease [Cryobacterium sp. Y62]|uniref:TRAP transporter large permease n=1 Tax=Cryobacterium sp. Y62 TaxID=2048284 RepID=UPI000CE3A6FC|nr:TRAP transporter large permease [Cryobacterium sp. Y62]